MARLKKKLALGSLLACAFSVANANPVQTLCRGNIETPDRKIMHAGVSYWLWYDVTAGRATVRIAGREFNTTAETGTTWPGFWLHNIKEGPYLSFLPSDGGTIRVELETGTWFSGNCLPDKA
jgi:hypothetical protein